MSIPYSKYLTYKKVGDTTSGKMCLGRTQSRGKMTLSDLAKHMQEHNTQFSAGVILGLLTDACNCVRENILNGSIVELGDLGQFWCKIAEQTSADSWDAYTANNIKKVIVSYACYNDDFKDLTNDATFEYVMTKTAEAAAKQELSTQKEAEVSDSSTDSSDSDSSTSTEGGV